MIKLPDTKKKFEHENSFYLTCDPSRIGKFLAHYQLYKLTKNLTGDFVECGIFKGISFIRFAMFRELLENTSKKMIGFDIFGKFPETEFKGDIKKRKEFIDDAGKEGITKQQLIKVLKNKRITRNIELVKGDITKTVPNYVKKHPKLRISLLNLDTDIYEPAVTILEHLYPKIVKGGILILDDYGVFPGETKAVDEFFLKKNITINKFPFSKTPSYIIK